jgi:hypothetical protein
MHACYLDDSLGPDVANDTSAYDPELWQYKTTADARAAAAAYAATAPALRERQYTLSGYRSSPLWELPYMSLLFFVVEPAHALYLGARRSDTQLLSLTLCAGLGKWAFHTVFVESTLLRDAPDSLQALHALFRSARPPSSCGRVSFAMGLPAGGSPKSDEWRTFWEVYCPSMLYQVRPHASRSAAR